MVAQWIEIHLPMQEHIDPWPGKNPHAKKQQGPLCHSYWAWALQSELQLLGLNAGTHTRKPVCLEPVLHARSHSNEEVCEPDKEQPPFSLQLEKDLRQYEDPGGNPNEWMNQLKNKTEWF